jgi:hypothetical protein
MDEEVFKSAARVTSAFLLLLTGCLLWQGLTRTKHMVQVRCNRHLCPHEESVNFQKSNQCVSVKA